jgi:hypothetical protein
MGLEQDRSQVSLQADTGDLTDLFLQLGESFHRLSEQANFPAALGSPRRLEFPKESSNLVRKFPVAIRNAHRQKSPSTAGHPPIVVKGVILVNAPDKDNRNRPGKPVPATKPLTFHHGCCKLLK